MVRWTDLEMERIFVVDRINWGCPNDPSSRPQRPLFLRQGRRFGSYTAAAKALGLQTSKLSRRIAALEGELGVRLINRTTRRLSLTEAGKTFHRPLLGAPR